MMISPYLVDDIGPIFNDLKRSIIDLQMIDPARLAGDGMVIDGAILALGIVRERIRNLQTQHKLQAAE